MRDRASSEVEAFRKRMAGFPIAMAIRMLNTYRSDQLAYDGLVDYAFERAWLSSHLFIQGPPEEKEALWQRCRKNMESRTLLRCFRVHGSLESTWLNGAFSTQLLQIAVFPP